MPQWRASKRLNGEQLEDLHLRAGTQRTRDMASSRRRRSRPPSTTATMPVRPTTTTRGRDRGGALGDADEVPTRLLPVAPGGWR